MVPCAQDGGVGQLLPCSDDVGVGSEAIGIEIPHAVVVALHACALEAIDAGIESGLVGHAAVDVVAAVVVDLSLDVADDGMNAPDVGIVAALTVAEDAGSIGVGYASETHGELRGVIGQQQVAAVIGKSLQSLDGGC